MKSLIGIIVVLGIVYVLFDLDVIDTSIFGSARDYIQEKGSQAWSWLT